MKLTVIGGGGVRSMFLAKSLVQEAQKNGIRQIVFMDNDEKKLSVFGGLAKEVAHRIDSSVDFQLTSDPVAAVSDASYVITTIRAGQDEMRISDEKIALAHNVLGQETTGAGGFAMALRSVNILASYCELIEKHARPGVLVFNFTNPAGLVSQALRYLGFEFTYGICDAPSGLLHTIATMRGCNAEDFTTECYGLNHLSFFKSIRQNGQEILEELLSSDSLYTSTDMRYFEKELAQDMGLLLNEYLYYYFYRERSVENIMHAGKTRGETILDINQKMMRELEAHDVHTEFDKCIKIFEKWYGMRENSYMAEETQQENGRPAFRFDMYSREFGGYAGVAMAFINAVQTRQKSEMILCLPNNGAIGGLRDDDVVEITCTIDENGAVPKQMGTVSDVSMELIRRVKIYERKAAMAIIQKDRKLATQALMLHPLVNSYETAKKLVNEYLKANKEFCGEWE